MGFDQSDAGCSTNSMLVSGSADCTWKGTDRPHRGLGDRDSIIHWLGQLFLCTVFKLHSQAYNLWSMTVDIALQYILDDKSNALPLLLFSVSLTWSCSPTKGHGSRGAGRTLQYKYMQPAVSADEPQ